jgi:hypothetical protein
MTMKLRIEGKQRMKTRILRPRLMKLQRVSLKRENEDEMLRTKLKTKPPSRLALRYLITHRLDVQLDRLPEFSTEVFPNWVCLGNRLSRTSRSRRDFSLNLIRSNTFCHTCLPSLRTASYVVQYGD